MIVCPSPSPSWGMAPLPSPAWIRLCGPTPEGIGISGGERYYRMGSKLFSRTPNSVDPFGNKCLPSFFMTVDFIDFCDITQIYRIHTQYSQAKSCSFWNLIGGAQRENDFFRTLTEVLETDGVHLDSWSQRRVSSNRNRPSRTEGPDRPGGPSDQRRKCYLSDRWRIFLSGSRLRRVTTQTFGGPL